MPSTQQSGASGLGFHAQTSASSNPSGNMNRTAYNKDTSKKKVSVRHIFSVCLSHLNLIYYYLCS